MMGVQVFTLINAVIGAILAASGTITGFADTLGTARWVSVVLGVLGVIQLIVANILHVVQTPTIPPKVGP